MVGTDTAERNGVQRSDRVVRYCDVCERDCDRVEYDGVTSATNFLGKWLCEECYASYSDAYGDEDQ